ncbi:Coenzyme F420 hydrogenase/dehydrogenase, beta subunit C-terminal domain [Roseibium aestuarii]|uniref:Coenzyme F420 hydrogenase/dehydrogenase, beta subunit C-terminal domain n=1 Tax=Roseibium aestuarii TaxID=2600299 RepID=A0ABW4JSU4_9HYPH|nr:Coenzyme F420 hydrogenase/dehydrogenase, beta subunit C-terminal domain [Roseibium aestuarii]
MSVTPVMPAASLKRVARGNLCAGCGLCASLAPDAVEMQVSTDGYLRPVQTQPVPAEVDARIARTCPGLTLAQPKGDGEDHVLWGPIVSVSSGASTDEALRHRASSGGALSAMLAYLIESGKVDRIVHIGADDAFPLQNRLGVSHDRAEILQRAGSRYAPSAPLATLLQELGAPGTFALVGKPCDIAAARALGREDPRVADKIPAMLSFFCAGVPSLKGGEEVLSTLGVEQDDVARFRYRGEGWPGEATAVLKDGRSVGMSYAASWGNILSRHVQFRCKICPDGTGGSADVVCADAWHADEKGYPLFEEQQGRSLVVTRSRAGEDLVTAARSAGYLESGQVDLTEIETMQPSQANRKRHVLARLLALRSLGFPAPNYSGYNLLRAAWQSSLRAWLRNYAGTLRRIHLRKW